MQSPNLVKLYQRLNEHKDWVKPKQLKLTRTLAYRMTQVQFAQLLDVAYGTYINWESGRYRPSSPAQSLLHIVTYHKELFLHHRQDILWKIKGFN